ncbi:portal protein [Afipia sp. P52-10]|uniref:phage portal protein n=1 Tax=Afipia sp. P52-10 TaxID=1429916 RepID=UPI0003DF052D|nr:phage portal protein [Afipia sp. P52-10]ETR75063.1 portal protein [Afipia sp. P52-10]
MKLLDWFRRPVNASHAVRAMAGDSAEFYGFDDPRFLEFIRRGGSGMTEAGIAITPKTALKNPTVLRCVSLHAFSLGMLPLHLLNRRTGEKAVDHPLFRILHRRPNAWQTAFEFKSLMQQRVLGASDDGSRGDAFALIVRSGDRVLQLVPLPTSLVRPRQKNDWSLEYVFQRPEGGEVVLQQRDIFHLRCGLSEDGISGLSMVKQAAEAIALAIQTEKAAARLFRNGMLVGGALSHPQKLSPEAYERLKSSMEERLSGADNAHKWMILEEGMAPTQFSQTGRDSQHLEQRKYQNEEISRPFGVPRPLLNVDDTSWGSGIDVLGQFFVRFGLNPWFEAWQQAIERCLLTDREVDLYEAKINAGALLRGSMKDQAEFFAKGLGAGGHQPFLHPDEAREWLDLPRRDDLPKPMGQKDQSNEP